MIIFLFMMCVYGLSNILVNEFITNFFREYLYINKKFFMYKLFTCMSCTSFWVGFFLSFLFPLPNITIPIINNVLIGLISSGVINLIEYFKIKQLH